MTKEELLKKVRFSVAPCAPTLPVVRTNNKKNAELIAKELNELGYKADAFYNSSYDGYAVGLESTPELFEICSRKVKTYFIKSFEQKKLTNGIASLEWLVNNAYVQGQLTEEDFDELNDYIDSHR